MGTKHKHYDVIVAWAAGEEIELLNDCMEWKAVPPDPLWVDHWEYRIKPKTVKKEKWLNIYKDFFMCHFDSKELADKSEEFSTYKRVACIRIEWEEEA